VLENARRHDVRHLVYASSSSIYGANRTLPYSTHQSVDHPLSLYAASKKANELMAHSYAHVYKMPVTGLRFFTVYGPWGRPDMAVYLFTRAIFENKPIKVFNYGDMRRDFTFVDDIAEGVVRTLDRPAVPDPQWHAETPDAASSAAPYRLYNIGNNQPVNLLDFISILERAIGKPAIRDLQPMQAGDVLETCADISPLQRDVGFAPSTPLAEGLAHFVAWYRDYHAVPT
jgi:UDP-glucuronate 4-epimerase